MPAARAAGDGRVITLRELASWERRLGEVVSRQQGSLEDRDHALLLRGVYADYAAIFASYVRLVSEDEAGLEALKRATFLAWYAAVEPACLTGVGELPESEVRFTLEALDRRCRESPMDAELRFMVPWYVRQAPFAIARVPGLANVQALAATVADPLALLPREVGVFRERGLMGQYWAALVERAR